MNDLIKDRDERTRRRKKTKRKMDSIIGLSYHDKEHNAASLSVNTAKLASKRIRLLDEGYFDNGFVIKKGTLEKYLNGKNEFVRGWEFFDDGWRQTEVLNLTDDFVGTVNLGHMDFATFPFIIGEWNRSDLSLVDIENDRKGIDVNLRLDDGSIFVKELKRQPYDIGISSEFWYHVNEADTASLSEMLGYEMPVIDEIFIFAYGLVGECGNVNSSGLELAMNKGELEMPNEEDFVIEAENDEIEVEDDEIETLAVEESEVAEEPIEESAVAEEEEAEELAVAEVIEATAEELDEEVNEAEEAIEVSEEVEIEEAEELALDSDEEEDDEADETELALAAITSLREMVATLTARVDELSEANESLKKTNRRLQSKLQSEREKKEKFIESTKNFSVQLLPNEKNDKPKEEKSPRYDYIHGDGIGEL